MNYLILLVSLFIQDNPYVMQNVTSWCNLYADDANETITLTSNAAWYQIDSIATFNGTRIDTTSSRLIFRDAGIYHIDYSVSFTGSASTTYHIAGHLNWVKVERLSIERTIGAAAQVGNSGGTGIVRMAINDTLDLRVNANLNSKTFNYTHINLSAVKIGN